MNHLKELTQQLQLRFFVLFVLNTLIVSSAWWYGTNNSSISVLNLGIGIIMGGLVIALLFSFWASKMATEATKLLWQAILHVSQESSNLPPPNLDHIRTGRNLITTLVRQVYDLASHADYSQSAVSKQAATDKQNLSSMVVNNTPLPLFVLDNQQTIKFVNERASKYLGQSANDIVGKKVYDVMNLSFPSELTFDTWLTDCRKNKVTDVTSWERVRLKLAEPDKIKQFDMSAYFTNNSSTGVETIMALFDRTERYGHDDQEMSFVALAVHELRTPITIMRGYIEVFEEELEGKLDPELTDFMRKLHASAQQLTAFVSNILNVVRIDEDQLMLQLREEQWGDILKSAGKDLELRAGVHGMTIEYDLAPDLPTVAVDRMSIYEVINNLIDNAIKYSPKNQKIIITSRKLDDGAIETTVKDFGVGIPDTVMPHLFDKFYRSHRSSTQVGGTGLGLYLSKSIIDAHGGSIWVTSKVGEGSVFGFTLQPFSAVKDELKNEQNKDGIIRGAHGWIKNHSLYRS